MSKHDRILQMVTELPESPPGVDRRLLGYLFLFNRGEYYEAHDVLEDLWLEQGQCGWNYCLFKGLIQLAGAFVHMQKHYAEPEHRVHGARLAPAFRLLKLAEENLQSMTGEPFGVRLEEVRELIT